MLSRKSLHQILITTSILVAVAFCASCLFAWHRSWHLRDEWNWQVTTIVAGEYQIRLLSLQSDRGCIGFMRTDATFHQKAAPGAQRRISTFQHNAVDTENYNDVSFYFPTETFIRRLGFGYQRGDYIAQNVGNTTTTSRVWWVPYWFLTALGGGYVLLIASLRLHRRIRRSRRRTRNQCEECGYDLRGSIDRCPECGTQAKALAK